MSGIVRSGNVQIGRPCVIPIGRKCDAAAIRRPDWVAGCAWAEGETRRRASRDVKRPDVLLLIAGGECDPRAVRRKSRIYVSTRWRGNRLFVSLSIDPGER